MKEKATLVEWPFFIVRRCVAHLADSFVPVLRRIVPFDAHLNVDAPFHYLPIETVELLLRMPDTTVTTEPAG
jgi:hypothetical protein